MTRYRVDLNADGTPEALEDAERLVRSGAGLMYFGVATRDDQSDDPPIDHQQGDDNA